MRAVVILITSIFITWIIFVIAITGLPVFSEDAAVNWSKTFLKKNQDSLNQILAQVNLIKMGNTELGVIKIETYVKHDHLNLFRYEISEGKCPMRFVKSINDFPLNNKKIK